MSDSYFLAFIIKAPFLVMLFFTAICRIDKNDRKKGCLYGKTHKQKIAFFKSLSAFMFDDNDFFREQYLDLLEHEKAQYRYWVYSHFKNIHWLDILRLLPI